MAKKATATFTADELGYLRSLAHAVWDEVGYDVLAMVAEEKGKSIDAVAVSRAGVIELALDAGRLEERFGSDMRRGKPVVATADLLARWESLDYGARIVAVKPGFTYTRYGT